MTVATDTKGHEEVDAIREIAVATLAPANLPFNLYILRNPIEPAVLYREKSLELTKGDLDKLEARGITKLCVAASEFDAYRTFVENLLQTTDAEDVSAFQRASRATLADGRNLFEAALRQDDPATLVNFAHEFAPRLNLLASQKAFVIRDVMGLIEFDFYTYTHAVAVATYSLALARAIGISSDTTLEGIAVGGLLHDIGKRKVDVRILNKPGRLTDEERRHVAMHPAIGFLETAVRDDVTWPQLRMIYEHHERLDGRGYPVGLRSKRIHPYAKICSVADVFHALTSHRPYRNPETIESALVVLERGRGTQFEPDFVDCWKGMVT